jgi:hypothetical protein
MTPAPGAVLGFLRALADHLERHAELAASLVSISVDPVPGGWDLHLSDPVPAPVMDASAGVIAWARSLGVSELEARAIPAQVSVRFTARLGDHPVRVWGCVNRLREALSLPYRHSARITLAQLEELARSWGGEPCG